MDKVTIGELGNYVGETVALDGWLYNKRSSGKIWFLILRDGTGYTQGVIARGKVSDNVFNLQPTLTQESSVSMTGRVTEDVGWSSSIGRY